MPSDTYSHDNALLKPIVKTARKLVSRDKVRMNVHGFDLDLTYILDKRLIAMGIPGTKADKVWRNNADEVADFFRKFHAGQFLFFNLSGLPYDYSLFDNRVVESGWPDHHAPSLELLHAVVTAMSNFYRADPNNCLAVHCLAGRGRTGTVICCFLLYANLQPDPLAAVTYFSLKRSAGGKDLTGPSQLRYIRYYYRFLHRNLPRAFVSLRLPQKIRLEAIEMSPVPRFHSRKRRCTPYIKLFRLDDPANALVAFPDKRSVASFDAATDRSITIPFPPNCIVAGDVQVKVFHRSPDFPSFTALTTGGDFSSKRESVSAKYPNVLMFRFTFHTDFHTEPDPSLARHGIVLPKSELDCMFAGPLTSDRFDPNFTVRLLFSLVPQDSSGISSKRPVIAPPGYLTPKALQTPCVPALLNVRPLKPTDHTDVPPRKTRIPPNYAFLEPGLIQIGDPSKPSAAETLRLVLQAASEAPSSTEQQQLLPVDPQQQQQQPSRLSLPISPVPTSSSPSSLRSPRSSIQIPHPTLTPSTSTTVSSPSPSSFSSAVSSSAPSPYPSAYGAPPSYLDYSLALPSGMLDTRTTSPPSAAAARRSWGPERSAPLFPSNPAMNIPVSSTILQPTPFPATLQYPYATTTTAVAPAISPVVYTSPSTTVTSPTLSHLGPTYTITSAPQPPTNATVYPYPTSIPATGTAAPTPTAADILYSAYPHSFISPR